MRRKIMVGVMMLMAEIMANQVGALKVKPLDASVPKWLANAGRAAEEFAARSEAAAQDWATNTAKAADTFGLAISAAGIKERFRRGVTKAGAQKFARKISSVGKDRYRPGIEAADADYRAGMEPYITTLQGLTLSARKPKGDPANYQRVEQVGKALNAKRLALLGAGGAGSS